MNEDKVNPSLQHIYEKHKHHVEMPELFGLHKLKTRIERDKQNVTKKLFSKPTRIVIILLVFVVFVLLVSKFINLIYYLLRL